MTPARVAEVQDHLRRRGYERREEFNAVLSWFLAEGLARRLAWHRTIRDELPLTGDLMLHSLLGGDAPFEWQAELLASKPLTTRELEERFHQLGAVEVNDGLALELGPGGVAEPVVLEGGRCRTVDLIGRLGRMEWPLRVLVRVDEQFGQKPCDYRFESVLGREVAARVLACPPTTLVALRLRAAGSLGAAPTAMKVLWDLYRMVLSGKVDPRLAPGCVADAFRGRGGSAAEQVPLLLDEGFAADASRQQVWAAFARRARVAAPELGEVVRMVRRATWPWLTQGVSGAVQ